MLKKIGITVAALFAAMLATFTVATPAQAKAAAVTYHSCEYATICLYQWENFSGPSGSAGRWQSSIQNIWYNWDGCLSLAFSYWPNGTPVAANNAGWVLYPGYQWDNPDYHLTFYDTYNCSESGGKMGPYEMDNVLQMGYLHEWWHRIKAVGVSYYV